MENINIFLFGFGLIFLILLSIIDYLTYNKKNGNIPAFLTTLFLITTFLLKQDMFILIIAGLFALLFTDFDIWGGIADVKVFIASGLLIDKNILLFTFITCGIAILIKWIALKKGMKQIPFIPVIAIAYVLVYFI